ncbi:MAG: hypothetical protein JXB40_04200 [Candidatus Omnitrophica bacterium]|nr:hypothetical protein [Candidatus Omnitrophota bacterium]
MRAKFLRTKYFTGSHIQVRYLSLLLVSMIVPLIFVGFCLYYLIFTLTAEQIGIPEYIAMTLAPVVEKIDFMLLVGIPPLFLLLLWWGIILSHRFAGPLERLEKELKEIVKDEKHGHRIVLRKNDDIRPIADSINRLLDAFYGRKR